MYRGSRCRRSRVFGRWYKLELARFGGAFQAFSGGVIDAENSICLCPEFRHQMVGLVRVGWSPEEVAIHLGNVSQVGRIMTPHAMVSIASTTLAANSPCKRSGAERPS